MDGQIEVDKRKGVEVHQNIQIRAYPTLRLRMPAMPVFMINPPSACGVESAIDNAGETPTLARALEGTAHAAGTCGGWLPARLGLAVLNPRPNVGGGCVLCAAFLFLPRISALAGDIGITLGLVERAGPSDDSLLPLTLSLVAWRPRERSRDKRVNVPGSVNSGGPIDGISVSDQTFVNGEKDPGPVLRLRDDVERAKRSRAESASYSRSGTASSLATSCPGATEGPHGIECDAGLRARACLSWTILSSSLSAGPEHESSLSESQPTDQLTSSTAAIVQR